MALQQQADALQITLTSFRDDSVGGDDDGASVGAEPANWGGIVLREDSDLEQLGIFLSHVGGIDARYGGGLVNVDGAIDSYTTVHLIDARPEVSHNLIGNASSAAVSADPNSFEVTLWGDYDRIGPDIHNNRLFDANVNGLLVRIDTAAGETLDKLERAGRFDDLDIVHVLSESLLIEGNPGGAYDPDGAAGSGRPTGASGRTAGHRSRRHRQA